MIPYTLSPITQQFRGLFVWFTRLSATLNHVTALDLAKARIAWQAGGSQQYQTLLGVRDPGAPPAPEGPVPAFIDAQFGLATTTTTSQVAVEQPPVSVQTVTDNTASLLSTTTPPVSVQAAENSHADVAKAVQASASPVPQGSVYASTFAHRPHVNKGKKQGRKK